MLKDPKHPVNSGNNTDDVSQRIHRCIHTLKTQLFLVSDSYELESIKKSVGSRQFLVFGCEHLEHL